MKGTKVVENSTDSVYKYFKERIIEGVYKPSEKLPESVLAEELGVSRNTIKNALILLQNENLVIFEKNKGFKVKDFTLEEVKNYLEIREALEGVIINSVAESISEETLGVLKQTLDTMKQCIEEEKFDEYSNLNKEFHNIIYRSSENQEAVKLVSIIKTQLIRFHFRTILVPGRNSSSLQEHTNIFEALRDRNPEEAEKAIKYHVSNVRKTLEQYYQFLR